MERKLIFIDGRYKDSLVGFKVGYFFTELSQSKYIYLSVGEALRVCHGSNLQTIMMCWVGRDSRGRPELWESFATNMFTASGKVGIAVGAYSREAIVCEEGFVDRTRKQPENWYSAIGTDLHPYNVKNDSVDFDQDTSFLSYNHRLGRLMNRDVGIHAVEKATVLP